MKKYMKITLSLFLTLLAANAYSKISTPTKASRVPAQAGRLNEDQFGELMKTWDRRIEGLKNKKEPNDIFLVAEKVIDANPDFMLVLAEDLAIVLKEVPLSGKLIRQQWEDLPKATQKKLISSGGENLWEMANRLNTKGNG